MFCKQEPTEVQSVPTIPFQHLLRLPLFLALSFFALSTLGQTPTNPISKAKLIALKNAGISDPVLIKQIIKDGIDFDMDADTTLELKKAGFSDDVLQALLQASTKPPSASVQRAQSDSPAILYKAGRYPELADRLQAMLKSNPTDYRTQALLIVTLLKMKENDAANAQFQQLAAHEQEPTAAPFVKQVKVLIDSLDAMRKAKQDLMAALKDYRTTDAIAIVDRLSASPLQKDILRINLDVYQGKFDQARDRFSKIQFASHGEKQRAGKIEENIGTTETDYKKVMERIEVYLHSPMTPVICRFPLSDVAKYGFKDLAALSVNEYVQLVGNLIRLVPLSDEAQNLTFHAELLTGNYDQLERLGDKLLKEKGLIRIPFFSTNSFFQVVVDASKKHVYTEPDPHPFQPKWPTKSWSELQPFDLPFDQIQELSQKAGHWHVGMSSMGDLMVTHPYALKFKPAGVAPDYALMNILYCTAGEKAELTVTRNLGQYILHVAKNDNIKTELADPANAQGPSSGWVTGLMMAGASMSSNPALAAAAVQGLQADQAQKIANYEAQEAAFDTFTTRDTFDFLEADSFTGLEELLGVLN